MALCHSCKNLKIQFLPDVVDNSEKSTYSGSYHSTSRELLLSAQKCPFCALIKKSFLRVGYYHIPKAMLDETLSLEPSSPILLRAGRANDLKLANDGDEGNNEYGSSGREGACLNSIEVLLNRGKRFERGRIYLYAPKGSLALLDKNVVRKPLLVDDTMKPSDLVQEWLNSCLSSHDSCQNAFSGLPVQSLLDEPKRLIKITKMKHRITQPSLRLINRLDEPPDRYVALSHCWGPPDKRPLSTTKLKLPQFLVEIPWHHLPQTFQDSILLCVELSIQYLWIDSLCIVQDDKLDWEKQSAVMGSIYEGAFFTIAASSATNSSQGLFKVRDPLNLVEIPYHTLDQEAADRVYGYIEPELEKCLLSSPLNQRAWVMQEYFLSRRTVHFTTHGLIWSCKNGKTPQTRYMTSEFGSSWERALEDTWISLVMSYTRRELTYNSDKLEAIKGLANKFVSQKRLGHYYHGLFSKNLAHDLLWYGEEKLTRDVGNGIPFWSWASTTGQISFKASVFENPEIFHAEIDQFPLESIKTYTTSTAMNCQTFISMEAIVGEIETLEGPVRCQAFCFEDLQAMGPGERLNEDYKNSNIHVAPTFIFLSGGKRLGWGVFDEHEKIPGEVFCLPLIKQKVWEGFAQSEEQYFLWVLLLRRNEDVVEVDVQRVRRTYERVGWGLYFVPSRLEKVESKFICLV